MAGEGTTTSTGTGTGISVGGGVLTAGGGTGFKGWLSETFLGVDLVKANRQRRELHRQRRFYYQAQKAAERSAWEQRIALAAATAPARFLPTPGGPSGTGRAPRPTPAPPPTTSGGGVPAPTWQDLVENFGLLALQVVIELLNRGILFPPKQPKFPQPPDVYIGQLGGADMAYLLYPTGGVEATAGMGYGVSQDPFGLGSILGGVGSIIGAIKGTSVAGAMPGGAMFLPAAGVGAGIAQAGKAVLPYILGGAAAAGLEYMTGALPSPTRRSPNLFVCEDPLGNPTLVRKAGTPLAFSGDVSAARRLIKAHRRIGKTVRRLRGGGR